MSASPLGGVFGESWRELALDVRLSLIEQRCMGSGWAITSSVERKGSQARNVRDVKVERMDKTELIDRVNASYERVEAALAELTPAQWLATSEPGAWSVKDIVAHLAAWLDRLVSEVEAAQTGKPPDSALIGVVDGDRDSWNKKIFEERREESQHQALGLFRVAHGRLVDGLHVLSEDDLNEAGRFDWLGDIPLWRRVAEDSWEHFEKHLPAIEQARDAAKI